MTTDQMLQALSTSGNDKCGRLAMSLINGQADLENERKYTGDFMSAVLDGDFPKALKMADPFNWIALIDFVRKHPEEVLKEGEPDTMGHLLDYLGWIYEGSKDLIAQGIQPGSREHQAMSFQLRTLRDMTATFLKAAQPKFSHLVQYYVDDEQGIVLDHFQRTYYYLDGQLIGDKNGLETVDRIFTKLALKKNRLRFEMREIDAQVYLALGAPPADLKAMENKLSQL